METCLPPGCRVKFDDPNSLHDFVLVVSPAEAADATCTTGAAGPTGVGPTTCPWHGGKFRFHIVCSEEYNMVPPTVKCLTRIWHPNINEGKCPNAHSQHIIQVFECTSHLRKIIGEGGYFGGFKVVKFHIMFRMNQVNISANEGPFLQQPVISFCLIR